MEYSASGRVGAARMACLFAGLVGIAACSGTQPATGPVASGNATAPSVAASAVAAGSYDGHMAGAVYTSTNAASGNSVVAFARDAHGGLRKIGSFATGGTGTGGGVDALGSQFAVVLGSSHRQLYVVNAGSNDITVFAVHQDGSLEWLQRVRSEGALPVSLALRDRYLFVLNAGDASVTAFAVSEDGRLRPLDRGRRALPSGAGGPSTIRVAADGRSLLVTERTANRIDVFRLESDGRPGSVQTFASHGTTPFGFDVGRGGLVIVSEAGPNAVSTYRVHDDDLDLEDGSVPTHQTATCWVLLTHDGQFAFAVNAGSASLSGFAVAADGTLSPVSADGRTGVLPSGSAPLDLGITDDDRFLFTVEAGSGGIGAFAIESGGKLETLSGVTAAVPSGSAAEGLAAF